jgi:2'-5' RNA ligase
MPDTTRTFVALAIPKEYRGKLGRLQAKIAPDFPGTVWVPPENFHVTLAFLGDVPHADLGGLCKAVGEAASGFGPMALRVEGLGVFPKPERPRVVWVGVIGPDLEALVELHRAVSGAAAKAGYPPADDRFHPHVTIGRMKVGRGPAPEIGPVLRHYQGWAAGSFTAAEVVTFSSTLGDEGPTYTPISRAPLSDEKGEVTT